MKIFQRRGLAAVWYVRGLEVVQGGISLSAETQRLIEERMVRDGYSSADEVVRAALESLEQQVDEVVGVDGETQAALDRADGEIPRGEYRELKEVAAELRAKYPRR